MKNVKGFVSAGLVVVLGACSPNAVQLRPTPLAQQPVKRCFESPNPIYIGPPFKELSVEGKIRGWIDYTNDLYASPYLTPAARERMGYDLTMSSLAALTGGDLGSISGAIKEKLSLGVDGWNKDFKNRPECQAARRAILSLYRSAFFPTQ